MTDIDIDELVYLHNDAREKGGMLQEIKPLLKNDKLMKYAQEWAEHMASRGRMYHSSMRDIMRLGFSMAGENIAYGQKSPEEVMRVWMNSPGHRSNILSSRYSDIGCGVAMKGNTPYWCTCFGVPSEGQIGIYGPC